MVSSGAGCLPQRAAHAKAATVPRLEPLRPHGSIRAISCPPRHLRPVTLSASTTIAGKSFSYRRIASDLAATQRFSHPYLPSLRLNLNQELACSDRQMLSMWPLWRACRPVRHRSLNGRGGVSADTAERGR